MPTPPCMNPVPSASSRISVSDNDVAVVEGGDTAMALLLTNNDDTTIAFALPTSPNGRQPPPRLDHHASQPVFLSSDGADDRAVAPAAVVLRTWFAALAPAKKKTSASPHAAATFTKAWDEAARLPSLWAKASVVYNAAIALTLDPTGRIAAEQTADGDEGKPEPHSLAEQLAATETALKQLLVSLVSAGGGGGPAPLSASPTPKGNRGTRLATVKSVASLKASASFSRVQSSASYAPVSKTKSAVFLRRERKGAPVSPPPTSATGSMALRAVHRRRRKSLAAAAAAAAGLTATNSTKSAAATYSTNATATTSSLHSTHQPSTPPPTQLQSCGPASGAQGALAPVMSDGGADDWSDVESDAAGGDDEQELLRSVDLQVTCHLTGGMNDSDDSDADDPHVLGDLNQFAVLERLGRGAEGEVFLAMDTAKSELRAIKAVRRPVSNGLTRVSAAAKQKLDRIAREIAIMKRMRHRNVVTLHEVIDDPARDTMYFVMQYVEHGPIATLSEDGTISETVEPQRLVDYARQLCSGLQYLHGKGVIHRDIKPENILRGANEQVYLADFGVSENFDDSADHRIAGTRGTPAFLAPELLQLRSQRRHSLISEGGSDAEDDHDGAATDVDGEAVDVWALGITLYVLLYGKLPWEFTNAKDLFEEIQRRPIELRQPVSPCMNSPSIAPDAPGSCSSYAESPTFAGRMRPGASAVLASTPSISVTAMPPAATGSSSGLRRFASATPVPANDAIPPMPDFGNTSDCSDDGSPTRRPPASLSPAALTPQSGGLSAANLSMTGPMARSFLPSGVMASNASDGWRRVLFGMLQRDPRTRSSLATVRNQLRSLDRKLEQAALATSPSFSSAFTQLHPN